MLITVHQRSLQQYEVDPRRHEQKPAVASCTRMVNAVLIAQNANRGERCMVWLLPSGYSGCRSMLRELHEDEPVPESDSTAERPSYIIACRRIK